MFFKRRAPTEPVPSSSNEVITIPDVFYAGNDPESQGGSAKISGALSQKSLATASPSQPAKTRHIAIAMITIFVLVLGAAGWYLMRYLGFGNSTEDLPMVENKAAAVVPTTITTPEISSVEATSTPVEFDTATSTTVVTTSSVGVLSKEANLEFPVINQIDAADLDADGLTDPEEEFFGTDPATFDTDADNYYDGQEVSSLYNPKALAPVRLIDSGLVKELTQTRGLYRAYYPLAWEVGVVDLAGDTTLLTAANGDYVEFRVSPKTSGEDFTAWFARVASTERITDLQPGANRFGVSYSHRKDDLVTYVDKPNFVLVIIYHPQSNAPIAFRHVMQMIVASLRLGDNLTATVPVPVVETTPPTTTSATTTL